MMQGEPKNLGSRFERLVIGAVYILTLVTQLPHTWAVYHALETGLKSGSIDVGALTALGASISFEAAVGIFTLRLITNRSGVSPWAKHGVRAFLVLSIIVNMDYYFDIPMLTNVVKLLMSAALPLALWFFAEEWGHQFKKEARQQERLSPVVNTDFTCPYCGAPQPSPQARSSHIRWCIKNPNSSKYEGAPSDEQQ